MTPPPDIAGGDVAVSIPFPPDDASLPESYRDQLTQVAARLRNDDRARLQLMAYASGDAAAVSRTRRLSLSRALEVRQTLISAGMNATRIDVRALGNRNEGGNPDRVDVVIVK